MSEITLESVTKRFGETNAVDDVSLAIEDGEILGVVGPSGCGKTTTFRTIAGFETPTGGTVRFDGEDVTNVPPENRNVGLVFQSYALFDNMTVRENVEFGPKMQGTPRKERREQVDELLELLDIDELADRDPSTLSGGQQQRVGLARALAIQPRILLLEEQMTGLDAKLKARLQHEIGNLLDDLDVTALYVTHDQEEAMVMCDRIAVMNEGVIEQIGTPTAVYEHPANEFVADFVGISNLFSATARNGILDLGFATIEIPQLDVSGDVTAIVRPDAISHGDGSISATVIDRFYLGERFRTLARLPDGSDITLEFEKRSAPAEGEEIQLGIDADGIHLVQR